MSGGGGMLLSACAFDLEVAFFPHLRFAFPHPGQEDFFYPCP